MSIHELGSSSILLPTILSLLLLQEQSHSFFHLYTIRRSRSLQKCQTVINININKQNDIFQLNAKKPAQAFNLKELEALEAELDKQDQPPEEDIVQKQDDSVSEFNEDDYVTYNLDESFLGMRLDKVVESVYNAGQSEDEDGNGQPISRVQCQQLVMDGRVQLLLKGKDDWADVTIYCFILYSCVLILINF